MALPSNDINDLNRKRIIESSDVPGQPGIVVLNPDGTAVGAPVGGATSANQTNGTQKTQIVDAGGDAVTVTGGKLDVNATASLAGTALPISGATEGVGVAILDGSGNQITSFGGGTQYTEGDTDASITGTALMFETNTGTNTMGVVNATNKLPVDGSGVTQPVSASSLPLPTGASTSANQTTIIGHLDGVEGTLTTIDADTGNIATSVSSLDTKTPALGQALAASSVPVVLTAAQITTLTPPAAITNYALETGGNLATIAGKDFATQTTLADINAKLVSGTDIGDVTINNAAGASAVNIQDGGNTITVDGTVGVSGTVAVTQSGTWDEVGINDSGNSITVDYATTGSGTATGALRVELPTNGTGVIATVGAVTAITNALPAGTNAIGKLSANSGVDIGDTDVTSVVPGTGATNLGKAEDAAHTTGDTGVMMLGVRSASPTDRSAGPTDGDYEPFALNEVGAIWVSETSSINGGDSTATASTADGSTALTNSAQVIKASAGKLTGYYIYNPNSSATYVNFYNTAAASVTVGTTNPLFNICIPATSAANLSGLKTTFGTAMSWSATTTGGGNTAPSTALEATCWYK